MRSETSIEDLLDNDCTYGELKQHILTMLERVADDVELIERTVTKDFLSAPEFDEVLQRLSLIHEFHRKHILLN